MAGYSDSVASSKENSLPSWLKETETGVLLDIYAQPGAKRDAVAGVFNGRLKIALTAPPVEGKANAHLVKLLSGWLKTPRSGIALVSGDTSRAKRVFVRGCSAGRALDTLSAD